VQLTKFTHSCVRFDDGDRSVVIDPGVFSEVEQALDGVDTVLITHAHPDHVDVDRVRAAAKADSRMRIWAPASVGEALGDVGEQVVAVGPGQTFEAGGFEVRTFGGQHAVIHPTIPVIANVGFLIEGVFHPGDALIVPPADVRTLLLPIHAPWSNIAQVIDFAVSVRAPKVYPIHNSLLNPPGTAMVEGNVTRIVGEFGSELIHLDPHDTVDTL
jgi:L-ascorbate metabolism protein UlaG (beta-lactamase superfamily)